MKEGKVNLPMQSSTLQASLISSESPLVMLSLIRHLFEPGIAHDLILVKTPSSQVLEQVPFDQPPHVP